MNAFIFGITKKLFTPNSGACSFMKDTAISRTSDANIDSGYPRWGETVIEENGKKIKVAFPARQDEYGYK